VDTKTRGPKKEHRATRGYQRQGTSLRHNTDWNLATCCSRVLRVDLSVYISIKRHRGCASGDNADNEKKNLRERDGPLQGNQHYHHEREGQGKH
jgi:hypothetical protein